MSRPTCIACGGDDIRPRRRQGRKILHRTIGIELPSDLPVPTCLGCGAFFVDAKSKELRTILDAKYLDELRIRARWAIGVLCPSHLSQRHLERLLGLSQGYLTRMRSGEGNPSSTLVALLGILALNSSLLSDLESFWHREPRLGTPQGRPPTHTGGAMTAEQLLNVHRYAEGNMKQTATILGVSVGYAYALLRMARRAVTNGAVSPNPPAKEFTSHQPKGVDQ